MARPNRLALALAALLVLLAPGAAAAEFTASAQFSSFPPEERFQFLSGSLEATLDGETGAYGFLELRDPITITGATKVCSTVRADLCTVPGKYTITVQAGGAAGLSLPKPSSGKAAADHAIAFAADLSDVGRSEFQGYRLGESLVALTVGGTFTFTTVAPIPETLLTPATDQRTVGAIGGVTPETLLTVARDGTTLFSIRGNQDGLLFQGNPQISTIQANALLLPFESGTLQMARADSDAAERGLDLAAIQASIQRMQSALQGGKGEAQEIDLGPLGPIANRVLNGAFVAVPTNATDAAEVVNQMELVRFDSMAGRSSGSSLRMSGDAPLAIQSGRVQDAQGLFLFMPWWSWLLWALAIAAVVVRVVRKAPKAHPKWDKLKWIGWAGTAVAGLLFAYVVDSRFNDTIGVSAFHGAGDAFLAVAAVELLLVLVVLTAVVFPLRILLRNGFRIAQQGTFMGIAGPIALLVGILVSGGLLLSCLDAALQLVGGS